jgi:hypothetical protein
MPLSQLPGVSGDDSALIMDFLLILRRALAQQAPVKQALYRGIQAILDIDSACTDAFLPLLYPRLQACMPQVRAFGHLLTHIMALCTILRCDQ